jgi:hypothetical protein
MAGGVAAAKSLTEESERQIQRIERGQSVSNEPTAMLHPAKVYLVQITQHILCPARWR